jgi:heme iron utilization protein
MNENRLAADDFDASGLARTLLRTIRSGALATVDPSSGAPFASLVSVATDMDGSPLLLVSRLAVHTTHLDQDPRASLLLAASGKGDPLAHPRLTLMGRVAVTEDPRVRRRFLARHPKAELYADFPDFSFRRLTIEGAHLNGGFARAALLSPSEILTDIGDAEALLAAEEGALAHMNADHREALALYATVLAGAAPAEWRATGLDPDGMDLAAGDLTARLPFAERVQDPGALRQVLVRRAEDARRLKP